MKFDSAMLLSGAILTGLLVSSNSGSALSLLGLALMGGGLIIHIVPWLKKFQARDDKTSSEND